jgi:hypothetical protein
MSFTNTTNVLPMPMMNLHTVEVNDYFWGIKQ